MNKIREAADAYAAEKGFEHSGGVVETAFEAGARWATQCLSMPYGYIFGGCTFLPNGSPLVTEYVAAHSLPVFLQPAENVMETYKEVMAEKIGDDVSATSPKLHVETDRLRRMVERRDDFIIANGLWDAFMEANREAE